MLIDFLDSYLTSMERMSYFAIQPFVECEVQPSYAKEWKKQILLKQVEIEKFNFLNPSICRSMLVMDLLDSYFLKDLELRDILLQWYNQQLNDLYDIDKFSKRVNLPKIYNNFQWNDYTFFVMKDSIIVEILSALFQASYKKFHDIFADNSYEVTGPYYTNGYTIISNRFSNLDNHLYNILQCFKGRKFGTIDMFGHSDFSGNCEYVMLIDNEVVIDDFQKHLSYIQSLPILYIPSYEQHIKNRLFRYKNYSNLTFDIDYTFKKLRRIEYFNQFKEFLVK